MCPNYQVQTIKANGAKMKLCAGNVSRPSSPDHQDFMDVRVAGEGIKRKMHEQSQEADGEPREG